MALVSEAPGYREAKNGQPFFEHSGQLLDQVLEYNGLHRSDIYIDNACACRTSDGRTPTAAEVKCCAPRLFSNLGRLEQLETIVTLGNTASQKVLGTSEGITSLRVGPPKRTTLERTHSSGSDQRSRGDGEDEPDAASGGGVYDVEGVLREVTVVPTFHPASCLYSPDSFPHFVTDIGKVVGKGSDVKFEPPAYKVFDTPEDASTVLVELMEKFDEFVIDIEVGIEKDIDFDHPERYQYLCVGIGFAPGKVVIIGEGALKGSSAETGSSESGVASKSVRKVRRLLAELLLNNKIVCHNGKFDIAGLGPITRTLSNKWPKLHFDTMLASYTWDERGGIHSLDYLSQEYLGAPNWKDDVKPYLGTGKNYAHIPRPILYKYNAYDVHCTWLLKDMFEKRYETETEGPELRKLHDWLCRLAIVLIPAEAHGLGIDLDYLEVLTEQYTAKIAELRSELQGLVGDAVFNPNSPQQVKKYLHEQGFRVASTDKDSLTDLKEKKTKPDDNGVGDFVRKMLLHRRQAKLYGTYVKGTRIRMHNGRVHPTFMLHGTTTGRLACRNPNLFNVPRESALRKLYVPGPGNVFVSADYKTAELVTMSIEAEDELLATIFREGRDIHNEFSLIFYGEGFTKDQRVRTKAFVFGSAYGREAFSIAQEYDIPVSEALSIQTKFFDAMPGVMKFRADVEKRIKEDGELVTRFGRRRRFPLLTNNNIKDAVKEGLAFIPQSTASDVCQEAFMRARNEGLNCILSVYDSIMIECPEEEAQSTADTLSEIMRTTAADLMGDFAPYAVDVDFGKSWGDV